MPQETMKGYIARNKNGNISLYDYKPKRKQWKSTDYINYVWQPSMGGRIQLNKSMFPEITWDDEPKEVEITINLINK